MNTESNGGDEMTSTTKAPWNTPARRAQDWNASRALEAELREARDEARKTGEWKPLVELLSTRHELSDIRTGMLKAGIWGEVKTVAAHEWLALVEAAIDTVNERDQAYEIALRTNAPDVAEAKAAYEAAKRSYRRVEADAFADGFHWTCGRCGGTGRWIGNGSTCFNCGGSGFHPTQSKRKFDAAPNVRLKREAKADAKQQAERDAFEAALVAIGGKVEAKLREIATIGDEAMHNGEGFYDLDREQTFVYTLVQKLRKYGSLSEGQLAAIERGIARDEQKAVEAERMAEVAPLAEGKREIEGEIVTTRWQESMYGSVKKMLVKLDDGTKVWGSVPSKLDDLTITEVDDEGHILEPKLAQLEGARVRFTATVERSKDDPHFGFFKRPTKAVIVK